MSVSPETCCPIFCGRSLPSHAKRSLPAEERDRLSMLGKIATSIAKWKGKAYTGSGAREEAIRVRLEPYCDLGLLRKPNREKFEYEPTDSARALMSHYGRAADIDEFLQNGFFAAVAACRGIRGSASERRRGHQGSGECRAGA